MEKGQKKMKRPVSDDVQPGPSNAKKGRPYPPLDESAVVDEEIYQRHLKALDAEIKKNSPRKDVVLNLMAVTFVNRREFVLEVAASALQILENFPAFRYPEAVSCPPLTQVHLNCLTRST